VQFVAKVNEVGGGLQQCFLSPRRNPLLEFRESGEQWVSHSRLPLSVSEFRTPSFSIFPLGCAQQCLFISIAIGAKKRMGFSPIGTQSGADLR